MNKDDMLPEEYDVEFEELITLLQHADFIDPGEQAQIIVNARARLFPPEHEITQPEHISLLRLRKPKVTFDKPRRRSRRLLQVLNMLAAILVIVALIGASLILFRRHQHPTSEYPTAITSLGSAQTQALGLKMAIQNVTSGPYFLGEMVDVRVSLMNQSQTFFRTPGVSLDSCPGALRAVLTGGTSPYDTTLKNNFAPLNNNCTLKPLVTAVRPLRPGEGTGTDLNVALTSSGSVTLTAEALFQKSSSLEESTHSDPTATTYEGHSEPLNITVQDQVPPNRSITSFYQNGQLHIEAPPAAQKHLIYREITSGCNPIKSNIFWSDLKTSTLPLTDCGTTTPYGSFTPTPPRWWKYVVGAPGYLMIAGEVNGS